MYPGSPEIARYLSRAEDRLIFIEKHPQDSKKLTENFAFDGRAKVVLLDGYVAAKAFLPPKERRGLVLMDPPFEDQEEFENLFNGFNEAYRKWPSGMYLLWYPLKHQHDVKRFLVRLSEAGIPKILRAELYVKRPSDGGGLTGTGMIIVNPPWKLEPELGSLMPWLDDVLLQGEGHHWTLDWLAGEARKLDA
jgi:23S rRNA (adenine2030-N6)-methyltransferase